ncbi:MAG TPA: ABC transporter permease, partial [Bryobacteraceae bacterium]|nr:ABC transporter permease [Bryobacteraceae bacterium]
ASAVAVLSLALGIGASMAAFRLIDALFLQPLPITHPERLYALTFQELFDSKVITRDEFSYPAFPLLSAAVKDQAELLAINYPYQADLAFGAEQSLERVWLQYVSGPMFADFGLKPALGRFFTEGDDLTPGARPYAVISYDYWSRRFTKDPHVLGASFRIGSDVLEVIGVAPQGFTGTDPGEFTDVFIPNMMNPAMRQGQHSYQSWSSYRIWLIPNPGANLPQIQERLSAALRSYRKEAVKAWAPGRSKQERDYFTSAPISLVRAANGDSRTQDRYRGALAIFAVFVGFVLLIACANVANLMTAQAAARAHELALRVSIGAGRARLIQLVLIESALIAVAASALGFVFSWRAAPFLVARLNASDQAVRLALPLDAHVAIFAIGIAFAATLLFGLVPALRASSVKPAGALRGGDRPLNRRRSMAYLIAAQAAFCFFVLFVAGQFVLTFEKMANQPTGFSAARVLTLESVAQTELPSQNWYQAVQRLKSLPGVESAALAQYALMSFHAQNRFVGANGHAPDGTWNNSAWFLGVSPGWFETMKLDLLDGRDFRWDDQYPDVAIVNEKFARRYFGAQNPLGRTLETSSAGAQGNSRLTMRIIGVVRDARYEDMRLPVPATMYVPLRAVNGVRNKFSRATFLVLARSPDPISLAPMLRREIPAIAPGIQVSNVVTQEELVQSQMVRERLLATLSLFFAGIALILAALGLYGVLNYAVIERRRELGIRIALGARGVDIAWRVTARVLLMLIAGAAVGLALGFASEGYFATMLYRVEATDLPVLITPAITIFAAVLLAAIPPVVRAIRLDPSSLLRAE